MSVDDPRAPLADQPDPPDLYAEAVQLVRDVLTGPHTITVKLAHMTRCREFLVKVDTAPVGDAHPGDIDAFVARVNARAEADMLAGNPVTGAHHRALTVEHLKATRAR